MKGKENSLPATSETATTPVEAKKKTGKLFIILSYALALASLIAMLFVPLFEGKMFIQYLLAAVAPVTQLFKVEIPASAYGSFFVTAEYGLPLSIMILCVTVSVVVALILLIPVIAGKAAKGTNLRCAFAGEIIAFLCVAVYTACDLHVALAGWNKYSLLIAIGVLALVMAAQAIKYKGWLGTTRFIIFLLALITLFTLYDIALVIPALEAPLLSLSSMIGAYDADVTFIGTNHYGLNGVYAIVQLCQGQATLTTTNVAILICELLTIVIPTLVVISVIADVVGLVAGKKCTANGKPLTHKGWFVFALVRYLLILVLIIAAAVLSFVLEGFGKIGIYMYFTAVAILLSLIVAIVSYCVGKSKLKAYNRAQDYEIKHETLVIEDKSLEEPEKEVAEEKAESEDVQTNMFGDAPVVAAVPVVVDEAVEEQPKEGQGEQLSIDDAQPVEEAKEVTPVEEVAEPVAEAEVVEPVQEVAPVEEVAEPVAAQEVVEPVEEAKEAPTPTHIPSLFGDEAEEEKSAEDETRIDPFIDKLTDEERAQFYDVFVNRNQGKIGTIPVYRPNENNADFFPAVFVHINRTRRLCSDSLLAKIYREIGKD